MPETTAPRFLDRFRSLIFGAPEIKAASLASPDAMLLDLFAAQPAASGVTVSPRNAMSCAPVRCAVQAIAEAIGQLPVHVYARAGDGSKERAPDHPVYGLLHDDANDWTPASGFREQLTRDALLHGNGFAYINRVDGRPVELLRLAPDTIRVEADSATGEPVYHVNADRDARRTLPRADVLHIAAPSIDGIAGASPVTMAREAIGLAIVMEQHAARLFGNGARPSGVLKHPGKLDPASATRIGSAWRAMLGGSNSGGTAILEEGMEFQALSFKSVDAQFLEMRAFAIAEIARVFRVPPVFLMDYGRATWANSEEMGRQFLTYCLTPWLKRWEGEIRLKLFAPDERRTTFAEFLIDDLLRADFATRMDGYGKAIAARILNPNEARAAENRPPYANGDRFENPNTTTGTADA
ncbi:HK97 family phage portal protein [Tepidamorphus gemmatus]|uniref:HK97 family phage portal protein n=1 Tax=Tepidamorphus gemmatus TaxID=747076 RepID=A0A4R3MHI3_9HYPH|nr:phage portal protein [Tepidamorphus gemmatus]TCT12658.1 HK97 family phage portal protein [Tepidamorphus gemmatus]